MALKCTPHAKFQLSATEIQWGESGPVDIADTWLANNDFSHLGEFGIGQEIILICKLLLHWNVLKPFLLNSSCLNWLNDWYLVLGNKHCRVRPLCVHASRRRRRRREQRGRDCGVLFCLQYIPTFQLSYFSEFMMSSIIYLEPSAQYM